MITVEHLHIGKEMMSQRYGLCALQVSVARDENLLVGRGQPDKGGLKRANSRLQGRDLVTEIETQVGRHLIITAASRMKLGPRITDAVGQLLLDIHVNIFQIDGELNLTGGNLLTEGIQTLLDGGKLGLR